MSKNPFAKNMIMTSVTTAIFFAATMAAECSRADTWTNPDTGYTWTYSINGDGAWIFKKYPGSSSLYIACVSPLPTGAVTIPSSLGGKPVTVIGECAFRSCSGLTSVTIPDSVKGIGSRAFQNCGGLTSVTIPDGVTSINWSAFSGCSGLTSVMLPDSVTYISDYAFSGCSNLTSVTIPDGVTRIGDCAFRSCSGLTSMTIPDSVTSIGSRAFQNCGGLTSVTIGNGVTSIGSEAFYKCGGLTSVTIGNGVTSIGSKAFLGCGGLMSILVAPGNANYKSENGLLLSKDGKTLVQGVNGNVVIPGGVTSIEEYAFYGCSGLASVTIPDGVTSIGDATFYGCSGLTSIKIPNNVTNIGNHAFLSCSSLTSVTIPYGVTKIGMSAFYGCSDLTSMAIPNSVTNIGSSAFYGCRRTMRVYVSPGDVERVKGLMSNSGFGISGVTFIEAVWVGFDANGGVVDETIRIASTNSVVGELPVPTWTGHTFMGWWSAANGGTQISASTTVTGDVTYYAHWTINQYAVIFDANGGTGGWSRKQNYGTAIVPPTVTREWCTFTGWSPAVAATVPANNVTYTAQWARWGDTISASKMGGKTMKQLYPSDYTRMTTVVIEEGVLELPVGFFDGCAEVVSVTWPSTLVEFGIDAVPSKILETLSFDEQGFKIYNGWILDYQNRSASAVTIPEGIVGIGRGAFKEMFDLETVTMPESLKYIASGAFKDCSYIQNLQFMSGLRYVGQEAFSGCSSLLTATFADGVEYIGIYAFEDCWQMQSVRLPFTVTDIGYGAFFGCSAIRGVTVPTQIETMQDLFPAAYSQIETAEVAEGETAVMDDMFKGCVALRGGATQTDMSMIPNTVTNIGARAFQGCTSLTAFVVPDSVVKIGESVFQGCSSLWNVTLSRSLTEIPDYAFYGCSMLETMVVPENVTYLGNRFFSGRTNPIQGQVIENALYYLCANAPDCHSGAYSAIAGNMTTYVLQNSRSWDGRQGSRVLPQSWNGYAIEYWTPIEFEVTFDANGGRFDSSGGSTWSELQIKDTAYALPSKEPVRPGWAFEGWWTEQTGGAEVRYTTKVTATRTHTLYAHWRSLGERMTVTFNSNGGRVVTPGSQDYVSGQTFGQFPVPTRRGYTFLGWWTEAAGGRRMTEETPVPDADMELFAHWEPITYYVRFHANGGTGTMTDQPFVFDARQALKTCVFTRTGFAFTGWATSPEGQVRYAGNASVVNLEEVQDRIVDLYAVWSGVGYSVRFDSNGGTGIMGNQTIAVGETQNLWPCVFARAGYTFVGWALSPTEAEAKEVAYRDGQAVRNLATSNGADVPLYAVWVAKSNTVRITFDANGGSVAPDYWDCVVNTAVEAFPLPTRPGFTFAGWWTARTGGTRVASIASATSSRTFYAHWTRNGDVDPGDGSFTVTFNANGGSVSPATRTVSGGSAVGALPEPVRTGYRFLGWFTAAGGGAPVTTATKVTGKVTYYAHWQPVYFISFHRNDASDEKIEEYEFDYGVDMRLPSLKSLGWARRGFDFLGWATSRPNAAKGVVWKKDWDIVSAAASVGKTIDVYAVWALKEGYYAIEFIRNDGAGTWRTVGFPYGEKTRMPSLKNGLGWARRGYEFKGWELTTADANDNTRGSAWKGDWANVTTPVKPGTTLVVYARWALMPGYYQIRFNRNDGSGKWRTLGYECGASTRLSTIKALGWEIPGYTCVGWGSNKAKAEAGTVWKADGAWITDAAAEGRTLSIYAIWE